jgi:CubicO group peptidase (beta-lactamase class C family)
MATAGAASQQTARTREPASKAAAILTWPTALREQYIAALDSFFLTRTVKAAARPRVLERGRALRAFESGGARAGYFTRFVTDQRVRGVLVLQDGKVRLEHYTSPHHPTTRWNSFSVAKSITSTLVGAAIKDGHIRSLDEPLTRYITALRGSAYDDVTIRQLLTMTSGVKWNEDYTDVDSDVARMYARAPEPGFDMTVSYVRTLPREAPPGTKWVYKTSETNLVGVLVAEATGKRLADYLSQKIWRPYGMERDAEWMIDDVGHEQGGCCLAMTLRDFARFGQFILDGARVDGSSIVSNGWLREATHTQVSTGANSGYGFQWWTRDDGTFEARGIYGQTLHIDPARHLVIVLNSAAEQPTDRAAGQARQEFIGAVETEADTGR